MLKTQRLTLREPCASDLDATFAIFSDPVCMKYWSTLPHEDPCVTKKLIDYRLSHWETAQTNFQIELNGELIGNAGNFGGNEIGFMLSREHWRKGYVSEAMNVIIPYLWDVTVHTKLTADADPNNAASVGLLTSLGFHETGRAKKTFNLGGVWSDSVYMALPRPR